MSMETPRWIGDLFDKKCFVGRWETNKLDNPKKYKYIYLKTYSLICPYLHFGIALCMYGCMSVTSFVSRTFTFWNFPHSNFMPWKAIEACMMVSRGTGRYSSHILKEAICIFFSEAKLYPSGLTSDMDCVQKLALRTGQTLQRLVT